VENYSKAREGTDSNKMMRRKDAIIMQLEQDKAHTHRNLKLIAFQWQYFARERARMLRCTDIAFAVVIVWNQV
jgi:hypothetical protein